MEGSLGHCLLGENSFDVSDCRVDYFGLPRDNFLDSTGRRGGFGDRHLCWSARVQMR